MTETKFVCPNCNCESANVGVKENTKKTERIQSMNDTVDIDNTEDEKRYYEGLKQLKSEMADHNKTLFNRIFNRYRIKENYHSTTLYRLNNTIVGFIEGEFSTRRGHYQLPPTHYIRCPVCNCKTEFNMCGE